MTSNEQEVRIANLTAECDELKRQLAEALQTIREAIFERDHAITALAKFKARVHKLLDRIAYEPVNRSMSEFNQLWRDCAPVVPSAPGSGEVKDGAK
jgi:Trm5-related predicted tRNA methylase